jgi:hypothetical protein
MSDPLLLTLNEVIEPLSRSDQRGHPAQLAFYESWTFVPENRQGRSLPG